MDVKPRTTRWRDTLPDVTDRREHRDLEALDHLSTALRDLRDGHENSAYEYAGTAAAHVRAWRTSLNHEAARRPDYPDRYTDDNLLWIAAQWVVDAARYPHQAAFSLRGGEAALRTIWRRHQEVAS